MIRSCRLNAPAISASRRSSLPQLFKRADFVTLHTPLTEKTKNVIDAKALATMKKGVRIINCARGGLVDEQALRTALDSGHVAGAAFDVFIEEPAKNNPLFGHPNVVCTPHLGAATTEAQENVALQIAEQMSDYLLRGAISNAVNFPSITAEEAPRLRPFIELAEKLGSFTGQLTESGINKVQLSYEGEVAGMNTKALTSAAVAGLLRPMLQEVNVVSAPIIAKERGIVIEEMTREGHCDYESLITVTVTTERQTRHVSGTVFADGRPRIVNIKGIRMDAEFGPSMIYITNLDKPGFIGRFSSTLAMPASTSRPSTSAATRPAVTRLRSSRSTASCRRTCSPRCACCRRCSRRGRSSSEPTAAPAGPASLELGSLTGVRKLWPSMSTPPYGDGPGSNGAISWPTIRTSCTGSRRCSGSSGYRFKVRRRPPRRIMI